MQDSSLGYRTCSLCHQEQPVTAYTVDSKRPGGRRAECRKCVKNRETERKKDPAYVALLRIKTRARRIKNIVRDREQQRAWRARNATHKIDCELRRKYGISLAEYDALLKQQGGVCALCGGKRGKRRFSVDHCHDTGTIRGLLCNPCNHGIGLLRDDPDLCDKAADYLRKHRQRRAA